MTTVVKINVDGTTANPIKYVEENLKDKLPVKIYTIRNSMQRGYYLEESFEKFEINQEIFGDVYKRVDRIITTFNSDVRKFKTTGVLLSGEKGSGKSLLAKLTANRALEENIPVVIVNTNYFGDAFNEFVSLLGEVVLFFDEFEKIYNENEQEMILTLLDGVTTTKKLVLMTVNEDRKVNNMMKNRPSRIFYHWSYEGLDVETIKEYSNKKLIDKSRVEEIIKVSSLFLNFNFDMLQSIVEEINRYGSEINEIINNMNLQTMNQTYNNKRWKYTVFIDGNEVRSYKSNTNPMVNKGGFYTSFELLIPPEFNYEDSEDKSSIACIETFLDFKENFLGSKNGVIKFSKKFNLYENLFDKKHNPLPPNYGILELYCEEVYESYNVNDYMKEY